MSVDNCSFYPEFETTYISIKFDIIIFVKTINYDVFEVSNSILLHLALLILTLTGML